MSGHETKTPHEWVQGGTRLIGGTLLHVKTCKLCGAEIAVPQDDYDALPQPLYIVRLWDGFDGEWMDVSEPLPRDVAHQLAGDKNEARIGTAAGKREGSYSDIDYYKAFPADTRMHFSEGVSQTRGGERNA